MHDFKYKHSELYAEDVPVRRIAEEVGTPLYIYSHKTLSRHYEAFENAFDGFPHIICFALKANSNPAILRALAKKGCGADVVSGGELYLALKAGIPAGKIVYAGVGKTAEEIRYSLKSRILMFNIESSDELAHINRIAGDMGVRAPVALRVNPDINAVTHPYISTGLRKHKFGIPMEEAVESYRLAAGLPNIEIRGIHCHIGSQITEISPFVEAVKRILALANELRSQGIGIKYLDIGGGLGISYDNNVTPHPRELAAGIIPLISGNDFTLIVEPGRSIAGNAGILVTKVLYLKKSGEKNFVIVDAGMNDLIRPSLYEAYHHILPVKKNRRAEIQADVVGPICESGDFFARERRLNRPVHGDLLAVMSAGGYGFSMSSNYNSRLRPAEVLARGDEFYVIRKREQYRDLTKGTQIPDFLK
ncbi:MAG: diaminopimelate decarboxylase [Deferribacteres bacterium]|nr:diaminopimelate decarboxylase [Deferribacteres bacterium]